MSVQDSESRRFEQTFGSIFLRPILATNPPVHRLLTRPGKRQPLQRYSYIELRNAIVGPLEQEMLPNMLKALFAISRRVGC